LKISVLQSLLAHQRTAINELHKDYQQCKLLANKYKEEDCLVTEELCEEIFKESSNITNKIAKRVKTQKELKAEIAYEIALERLRIIANLTNEKGIA
jgi:hypothetical protein